MAKHGDSQLVKRFGHRDQIILGSHEQQHRALQRGQVLPGDGFIYRNALAAPSTAACSFVRPARCAAEADTVGRDIVLLPQPLDHGDAIVN